MSLTFKRDAAERILATCVQAAVGAVSAEGITAVINTDSSVTKAALTVGVASLLAAIKAWAAKHVGNPEDASLLRD